MFESRQFNDRANGRLEQLEQQERVWFAWVCRLHDVHSGTQTQHSAAVLEVARRRWSEVRSALARETQRGFANRTASRSRSAGT
jgi:hypothetical protein